ncbi:MAG: Fe-Mn family superoxide dismutase [Microthrixaceae bacterium]|jgi:Fe-Mn family superoxide dismutase|nr:superoxide dismutase [Fe] [Actinomycetota bacterium]HMS11827.1 Fe-Mn family superoxide dismutase [Microthrixaceae bacterium]HMT23268.1 Fe-Mn family superoxide dismutase [Microthrixaceae bacterium]HMT62350.1 Fe-Mn family superoxide dismutase [Microthrixaceae bacterium]
MAFELPALPYALDALAPHISQETLEFHYGKHHQTYVTNLNNLTAGTDHEGATLDDVIMAADGGLFNNAAQVWNHTFYWNSMKPGGGGAPSGEVADRVNAAFGSYDGFATKFAEAATTQFGSGWAWLVDAGSGLEIMKTGNADLPMKHGAKALLTIDVWEHAYYIDFRNARPNYIKTYLEHLLNWDFVAANLD